MYHAPNEQKALLKTVDGKSPLLWKTLYPNTTEETANYHTPSRPLSSNTCRRPIPNILSSSPTLEQGCQIAKLDLFLSLDCARVKGVGAQSKERKGSNFAAQRNGAIVQKPEGPNTYNIKN